MKLTGDTVSMIINHWNKLLSSRDKIVSKRSIWAKLLDFSAFESSMFKSLLTFSGFVVSNYEFVCISMSDNCSFLGVLFYGVEHKDVFKA